MIDELETACCPLCSATEIEGFWRDSKREYMRCQTCALIWVPSRFHVSVDLEKAEYDLHENNSNDLGYRKFLGRLATPLLAQLGPESCGLDFGSGPGPTLSLMMQEAGHLVDIYDLYYANDSSIFEQSYDFITATEVVEHLRIPKLELDRLFGMLRPGGVLAIMTKLARDVQAFSSWHYKNDKTHIAFYSEDTFRWLARTWNCQVKFIAADVIFLSKPMHQGTQAPAA